MEAEPLHARRQCAASGGKRCFAGSDFIGGKKNHRSWQLRQIDEHHVDATANDIDGTAHGLLYGNEFAGPFHLMTIFVIGVIPFSITTVLASFFAARGNFKISFIVSLIVFLLSSVLYFTLIPQFGLVGGAISSAIAYLSATVIIEIWFCKKYKVSMLNLFTPNKNIFSLKILKQLRDYVTN